MVHTSDTHKESPLDSTQGLEQNDAANELLFSNQEDLDRLLQNLIVALKTVYDPEIPVDVYELGLIYKIDIDDARIVHIDMTLTSPTCPVAQDMPVWVKRAICAVPGIVDCEVTMVLDPPWDQSRMSDEARIALDMWS